MSEYIRKSLALEELEVLRQRYEMQDDCDELVARKCKEAVAKLPVADVIPVVHGKWIFNDDWWEFRCTECHRAIGNVKKYDFCPHCGAKMDGDNNETDRC